MNHPVTSLYALVLLSWPTLHVAAQHWCPPGAVWEYNFSAGPSIGCETRSYVGDTLIEGELCQRIQVHTIVYDHIDQGVDSTQSVVHTREANGVVYQHNVFGFTQPWDTLYWFNAPVGGRWHPPGSGDDCTGIAGMVEVLSIETRTINGLSLEVRNLGQLNETGEVLFEGPEMIQRIGTPLMSIPVTCPVGERYGTTLAFWDELWDGFVGEEASNCDAFNGIRTAEMEDGSLTLLGLDGDLVRINWTGSIPVPFAIHDARGCALQRGSIYPGNGVLDTSALSEGVHILQLTHTRGPGTALKWIKT